jgi:hypothetical protein
MFMVVRMISPDTTKNTRIIAEFRIACNAIFL